MSDGARLREEFTGLIESQQPREVSSPVLLPIPGSSAVAHIEDKVHAALIDFTVDEIRQLDASI